MKQIFDKETFPQSGRQYSVRVELHGGTAKLINTLSNNEPEVVALFDGTESPKQRRFKHEILEGEEWYFELRNGAKAFYR